MVKWILIALGALALAAAVVALVGWLLPERHVASLRARYSRPPEEIFDLIADPRRGPDWRSGLKSVEVLSAPGEPLRWREVSGFGPVIFLEEAARRPSRLVGRIDDPGQPFGGRWIYELEANGGGTVLTITEEGEVYNPFFRFMARFVFGHHRSLEGYLRDLGRHFGETVVPERVG